MADNPSFDFSSRDYATIRSTLLDRATRTMPDWTDRDPSDFGVGLVDLWAYMGDILHYYIDQAGQEAFISSATQRESVLGLSNLFDYTPRFRTAASGIAYITNSSSAYSVTLATNTTFSGVYNDTLYNFYTSSATTLSANSTTPVTVYEGKLLEKQTVTSGATGQIGQRYTLSGSNIVPSSVRVFVLEDGVTETEWNVSTNVNSLPVNTAGFSVYVGTDESVQVVFGNRLNGKIPPIGATIKATYIICSGSSGNVPANTITTFSGAVNSYLTVGSSTAFSGGSDAESVESIKRSLKATVRAQQRAVTLQDFVDYANLTSGVYRSAASYSASASTVTVYAMPYLSSYTSYSAFSASVPASVQTSIKTTLDSVALLGVTTQVATSVTLNKVNITATIYVKSNYVTTLVAANCINALDGLFSLDNLDFGKEVRIGDVYKALMAVDGVDYVTGPSGGAITLEMRSSDNTLIAPGALSPVQFLRKGTYTLTTMGGITV